MADLVDRLDRLPLAIELVAARLRFLPLTELCRRLGPLLPHLTGGPVDRPVRQRSLRAAIGWSYDLLGSAEQAAFRRLAAFRGGFELEAAQVVAAGPPVEDVPGAFARLVEAGLVVRPADAQPSRFTMLETIREYGFDQLHATGEAIGVVNRHTEHYANLVGLAERQLTGPDHGWWLERLTAEEANLRAVLSRVSPSTSTGWVW